MCGRFALYSPYPTLAESLRLPLEVGKIEPRYNVAPGTWITAVRRPDAHNQLTLDELWWGYRPRWADDKAPQPINATVEKVATSNYFKGAFAHHRCLVPADGWYEWVSVEGRKQPHYMARIDREPLWFAGIWTERPDGKPGCAILTEPARGVSKEIHPRMPLALEAESLEPWLDSDLTDRETIRQEVCHLDATLITHWLVGQRVNKPIEDDAELIKPVNVQ
jgi:putative SOS response-associated peptidase YedK